MPELPEVETTRRGIAPWLVGCSVHNVIVRQPRLRWPIPADLADTLKGHSVQAVNRRGKYLLLETAVGTLIIHLGMSGSLRILRSGIPPHGRHDHVDIIFEDCVLRFNDPRRFGAMLFCEQDPRLHPLLAKLGPEPLQKGEGFSGEYLYKKSKQRKVAVKNFLMDSNVVVGVGNIYANESLFMAGIRPTRAADKISLSRYQKLADTVRDVLSAAISAGGTTLRDFVGGDGKPGYFSQTLQVYGRGGEPCVRCGQALRDVRIGQRATVFCPACQR